MKQRGFTLVELLVVISIISLLSSITLVALSSARQKGVIGAATMFDSSAYQTFGANAVAIWPLDGNGLDQSGNGNNLSIGGTWSDNSYIGGGKSLQITGGSSNASLASPKGLPSNNVTVTAWVYVTQHINWINFVNNGWGSSNDGSWLLYSSVNGQATFGIYHSGGSYAGTTFPTPLKTDQWYHLAASYDGSKIQIFVNGIKGPSMALNSITLRTIGPISMITPAGPTVNIDNVRIYTQALTVTEIQKIFAEENGVKNGTSHHFLARAPGPTSHSIGPDSLSFQK